MAGSEDHKTYVWDLQTREIVQVLEGHTGTCLSNFPYFLEAEIDLDVVVAVAVRESSLML